MFELKPISTIATEIANEFYPVTSLSNAELRRMIIRAIEQDRKDLYNIFASRIRRIWLEATGRELLDE